MDGLALAEIHLKEKRPQDAEDIYTQLIKTNPGNETGIQASLKKADISLQNTGKEDAYKILKQALESNPTAPSLLLAPIIERRRFILFKLSSLISSTDVSELLMTNKIKDDGKNTESFSERDFSKTFILSYSVIAGITITLLIPV